MARPTLNHSRAAGFTLVEALVALIVLSVGLLGVAGLQISGLRANASAGSRTQASYLADDIIDRMRANRSDALAGNYNIALGAAPGGTDLASLDIQAWQTELTSLPGGVGSITVSNATNVATVSVQWFDSRGGDVSLCTGVNLDNCSALTFSTSTQL